MDHIHCFTYESFMAILNMFLFGKKYLLSPSKLDIQIYVHKIGFKIKINDFNLSIFIYSCIYIVGKLRFCTAVFQKVVIPCNFV